MAESATNSIIPIPSSNEVSDFVNNLASSGNEDMLSSVELLFAMTIASGLGALIAHHPKRARKGTSPSLDAEVRKTQILICVAGAILIPLIQGSLARAFALAGLGSFVRYRTVLSNPLDLSIIFVLIGLGMACGLQLYSLAFTVTGFIYLLLYMMNVRERHEARHWAMQVDCDNPDEVRKAFEEVAQMHDMFIIRQKTNTDRGKYRCRFTSDHLFNPDQMREEIMERTEEDVRYSRFDFEQREN